MTEWIDGILTPLNTEGGEGERGRGGEFFFPSPLMREGEDEDEDPRFDMLWQVAT